MKDRGIQGKGFRGTDTQNDKITQEHGIRKTEQPWNRGTEE